jgi:hypothetical protein
MRSGVIDRRRATAMSDFGNGRAGRADVVIVGGGSAGAVLARAKVLGGCSAHNATVAIRGVQLAPSA